MPDMTSIEANGITLEYDSFGQETNPTILLIMGLGTQMTAWPTSLCEGLAGKGFHVVRFDNRDVGLSEKFGGQEVDSMFKLRLKSLFGVRPVVPYDLRDMAKDAVGLLDSLGIEKAHIVGVSMGGMIAQVVASFFAERTLSLTSIMSNTGAPLARGPKPHVVRHMFFTRPKSPDFESALEHTVKTLGMIESPGYPRNEDERRDLIKSGLERAYYPEGFRRQIAAIVASGNRSRDLAKISSPTLVIHGAEDPLVPVSNGVSTARKINGARLEIIEGMGHDLPEALVPQFIGLISGHALAANE
jgi:pimeloyl-ACP methyl ester carboxylesterase